MKKNVTIAFTALLMITASLNVQAQEAATTKLPFGQWLTKTPWTIGIGMNIIDDNQNTKTFESIRESKWSPYKFTLDKNLVKNFGVQLAFSSTSFLPHNFLAIDLNFKYHFLKAENKFQPYALLGLGYAYRDYTENVKNVLKKVDSKNTPGLNLGFGASYWMFPSVGVQAQAVANLGKDKFMGFALGMVFKIGTAAPKKCEVAPKTKEAEDALQHLRGIINK